MFGDFQARYGAERARLYARRVVTTSWAVLLVITIISGMALANAGGTDSALPVVIRVLPLVLLGLVLTSERRRGYGWLAFVSLLYLVQGATLLLLPGLWWLGMLEALAALALGLFALSYCRWIHRWQAADS
ncbi:DUF2069 domain-containing protein [Kushneria aurantia]|uniref:DUF2069 domain-containing protein n=1 Tax=Kushneria aurantia TaxID=504092 RepID=A0ABV6G5X6_9GAMM|nr:DUF2069 domain-containing protein [Kushneria aurantia]